MRMVAQKAGEIKRGYLIPSASRPRSGSRQNHIPVVIQDKIQAEQIVIERSGTLNILYNDQYVLQFHTFSSSILYYITNKTIPSFDNVGTVLNFVYAIRVSVIIYPSTLLPDTSNGFSGSLIYSSDVNQIL